MFLPGALRYLIQHELWKPSADARWGLPSATLQDQGWEGLFLQKSESGLGIQPEDGDISRLELGKPPQCPEPSCGISSL